MDRKLGGLICALLAGCGGQPTSITYASYEDCILGKLGRGQSKIASAAIIRACRVKHPEAPAGEKSAQTGSDTLQFNGADCTQDCAGHEAGFEWAEKHLIFDEDDCRGGSPSFIEGCQLWARDFGRR